jgi:hypothetical protein
MAYEIIRRRLINMPGALAKALRRNPNPLQDIGNAVSSYLKRVDDEKNMQAFLDEMKGLQGDITNIYTPKTEMQATYRQQPSPLALKLQNSIRNKQIPQLSLSNANANVGLRSLGQQPTFEERQVPVNMADANRQATDRKVSYLMTMLRKNIPQERINQGLTLADMLIQGRQPVKPNRVQVNEGARIYNEDPYTSKLSLSAENPKDFQAKPVADKEIHTFTGSDGQPYTIFQKPDNTTYAINTITRKPAPEGIQVRDNTDGTSTALQALIYRMEQDARKQAKEEKNKQEKYNATLGAEWVPTAELINRGLADDIEDTSKYGGAYVIEDSGKPKLFFSDAELESYAKRQVPDAPNKWGRKKSSNKNNSKKGSNPDNDPLGLR